MMEDIRSIDYENLERRIVLKIEVNEKDDIHCFWMEKGELFLEFIYDKEKETFLKLEGNIGKVIANSQLDDKIKRERAFEALSHAMWYLNAP